MYKKKIYLMGRSVFSWCISDEMPSMHHESNQKRQCTTPVSDESKNSTKQRFLTLFFQLQAPCQQKEMVFLRGENTAPFPHSVVPKKKSQRNPHHFRDPFCLLWRWEGNKKNANHFGTEKNRLVVFFGKAYNHA